MQRRDLIQTAPELPMPRSRPSPSPAGQEAAAAAAAAQSAPSRREIKTVPGGGLNRISDGRAAASAYVGVKSLAEGVRPQPVTFSKVKLAKELLVENKEFRTEPALRGPSLPPPPVQSRVTPVSVRRTMFSRRGSPQAVVAVVGMLAVTVGVLIVVATGGRWVLPGSLSPGGVAEPSAAAEVVQWDHGIDGQPGVLAPPLADAPAPLDEPAGLSADVGPTARSAALPEEKPAAASSSSASARSRSTTTSRSDTSQSSKVDPEPETAVASKSAATGATAKPRSTRSPAEPPASQPERAPPQPWLE